MTMKAIKESGSLNPGDELLQFARHGIRCMFFLPNPANQPGDTMKYQTTDIVLTTINSTEISFTAGFDEAGAFFETNGVHSNPDDDRTASAFFSKANILIDGNGWCDIDSGGYLEEFISDVVFGDFDTEEFLSNISEALNSTPVGCLIDHAALTDYSHRR
jgi:hypothetical protein